MNFFRRHRRRVELVRRASHALGIDVGNDEARAFAGQSRANGISDVTQALHRDPYAGKGITSQPKSD
ncbi:MAG: hypothetical protein V3U93_05535, partial [Alphaproteobacteria bacterium]